MQIITQLPRYSDGEVHAALLKEIRTGFQLERAMEEHRVKQAAEEAKDLKGHKGDLRAVASIPERDFFRLVQKYGFQEVHSKPFMKYFQKKFPHLSPNKL